MRTLAISICLVGLCISSSEAQSGSRNLRNSRDYLNTLTPRPTVSPYLQLVPENGVGIGTIDGRYQTLVRPQFQAYENLARTQQSIRGLQNNLFQMQQANQLPLSTSLPSETAPIGFQQGFVTGHPTAYMGYSHYYPLGR